MNYLTMYSDIEERVEQELDKIIYEFMEMEGIKTGDVPPEWGVRADKVVNELTDLIYEALEYNRKAIG